MFILRRQDVEISTIQHPQSNQKIPVLAYQGQIFRLLNVFSASQEEEAKALWRDLTDHQGKACVLLEEPERFSVWGKIRLDTSPDVPAATGSETAAIRIKGCLLMLQGLYADIEDLLGNRQAGLFLRELADMFKQWQFPQADSPNTVRHWLTVDPLTVSQLPPWQEHHLNTLLQELHRLGRAYFGNTTFVERAIDTLQDLPASELSQFQKWLKQSPMGKLWR
ncbi:MAG TPA: Npun_F0813 family protein [Coleofasciculaceae cyanobacterium]